MDNPKKNRTIIIISLLTIVAGSIVMIGWIFNLPALRSLVPGFEGMRFNAALCFELFGFALLTTQHQTEKYKNLLFFILSLLGFLMGLVTLSQDLFHYSSGLDQLFIIDKTIASYSFPFPGRMAFNASVSFLFLGLGFLMLILKKNLFNIISQYFFHVVTIISAVALIGYLYGVSFFRTLLFETSMATHTAILFFILSLGAALVNPSLGIARLFTGKRVGNQMAKRLFTLMVLMVIVFGSLRFQRQRFQVLSSLNIGISLVAVGFLLVSLLLIWHTANWLNNIDEQRSKAEAEVKLMNVELEKRVEERSAEIQKSEMKYRSLIEQASDAIYVLDFKGNFTDVNASMCKTTGYSREELLQLNIEAIIDPEELITDPLPNGTNYQWGSVVRERRFMHKDRTTSTVEINAKVFSKDSIVVIARDITGRKKMETELKEAELKFRTIAEKSMVGVYIIQNGKFIYVNPRFAQVFGYEQDELINTFPAETLILEDYRAIASENIRRRLEGEVESINYEIRGKTRNGATNWVEFYGSRAIIGGIPSIIGSMIDITKRKKTEDLILREKTLSNKIINSLPGIFYLYNDRNEFLRWNKNFEILTGYTVNEIETLNASEIIAEEDRGTIQKAMQKAITDGYAMAKANGVTKDGKKIPFLFTGTPIIYENQQCLLGTGIDITEKLIAEESLQKSEANLQTILNTTDTAYALFDTDLRVLAFNQKAIEFVNQQYNHIPEKGDRLVDFFPQDKFPQITYFTRNVLRGNNINFEIDYSLADGLVLWYYVRLFPIRDDNKEILGILIALNDITDRKNAEQDLKSAYEKIQSHVNSIQDMAWKQSHIIRSPLANLKGLAALLKNDPSDKEILEHIQHELDRMDTIIIEMARDVSNQETHG